MVAIDWIMVAMYGITVAMVGYRVLWRRCRLLSYKKGYYGEIKIAMVVIEGSWLLCWDNGC